MKSSNQAETLEPIKIERTGTEKRPSNSIFKAAVYEALMMGLFQRARSVQPTRTVVEHEPNPAPKPVKLRHAVDQFESYLRSGSRI